jgi:hypothetical protein
MPPVERIEDVIVALIGGGAVKRAVRSIAVVFFAIAVATSASAADGPAEESPAEPVPIERILVIDQEGPRRRGCATRCSSRIWTSSGSAGT